MRCLLKAGGALDGAAGRTPRPKRTVSRGTREHLSVPQVVVEASNHAQRQIRAIKRHISACLRRQADALREAGAAIRSARVLIESGSTTDVADMLRELEDVLCRATWPIKG